jgi:hypothetical protein
MAGSVQFTRATVARHGGTCIRPHCCISQMKSRSLIKFRRDGQAYKTNARRVSPPAQVVTLEGFSSDWKTSNVRFPDLIIGRADPGHRSAGRLGSAGGSTAVFPSRWFLRAQGFSGGFRPGPSAPLQLPVI